MPTNRRRRVHRRRADVERLDFQQYLDLLTGEPFFEGFGDDLDRMRDAWEAHADVILAEWLTRYPGTRPFAWWLFEAEEPRRILDTSSARQWAALDRVKTRGILHSFVHPPAQEAEAAYLSRCHLLTDAEASALAEGRAEVPVYPSELAAELAG